MVDYLDRESLLRDLRLWRMHRTDSLPDYVHYNGIKAWLEAFPSWISASMKSPEENGRYLTVMSSKVDPQHRDYLGEDYTEVRITRFYKGEWKIPRHCPEWINDAITNTVLYWMPLPDTPEED